MNPIITTIQINDILTSITLEDITEPSLQPDSSETLRLSTLKGDIFLTSIHECSCCEYVVIEWSEVPLLCWQSLKGKPVVNLTIKRVTDMGIILDFELEEKDKLYLDNKHIKIFVSAYNIQNGYYSDDLELKVTNNIEQSTDIFNITECKEDIID